MEEAQEMVFEEGDYTPIKKRRAENKTAKTSYNFFLKPVLCCFSRDAQVTKEADLR